MSEQEKERLTVIIDKEVKVRAKSKAALHELSLSLVIEDLLKQWLASGEKFPRPKK